MVDYETKIEKYTVDEFYKRNKRKLPQIVMATQSVGDETEAEAFEYKQVIRIHSICRSQRVSALQPDVQGTQECTYSFPVDTTILFCLDENLNQNEQLSLAEILEKKTLPVDVHFAEKGIVNIGENTFSTSHFSTLRLTNVSEEIYLLGNYIFDDELDLKIVQIPISISTIKFSEVTGLKGKTVSDWKTLQRKLDRKAAQLNFDAVAGNPSKEISKSTSDSANEEDDIDDVEYKNFQTSNYTRIKKSPASVQAAHNDIKNSKDNTYEFMAPIPLDRVTKHISTYEHTENKPNQSYQMNQRKYIHSVMQADYPLPNVGELNITSGKRWAPRKMNDYSAIPQRAACPKSKHSRHADTKKCPHKEQFTPIKVSSTGIIICDVDTEYENLAKYTRDAARKESNDEGEHSSTNYENSGEVRGTSLTSLSETGSGDNDGLYETMTSSFPAYIKE